MYNMVTGKNPGRNRPASRWQICANCGQPRQDGAFCNGRKHMTLFNVRAFCPECVERAIRGSEPNKLR